MNKEQAQFALRQVAASHGVSTEDVVQEIEDSIAQARVNLSEETRILWDRLFGVGHTPSAEEFILCLAGELLKY